MGMAENITSLLKWLLPSGGLLLFLRARLKLEFIPIVPYYERGVHLDWNRMIDCARIRIGIRNWGVYAAEQCTVNIESIWKNGIQISSARQQVEWDSGGFEPRTILRGKRRGCLALLCLTEKGREPLCVGKMQFKESGVYEFKLRADSPELLTSPDECSIVIKYSPFSGELHIVRFSSKSFRKRWW